MYPFLKNINCLGGLQILSSQNKCDEDLMATTSVSTGAAVHGEIVEYLDDF